MRAGAVSAARKTLYRVALTWVLVAIGALLASAPIAWRTLIGGIELTRNESTVMAWVALMAVLSLPAGIIVAYIRSEARREREVLMWRYEELASP